MRSFLLALGLLAGVFLTPADAACGDGSSACWWIGTGNWNSAGNWSNSDGGASSGTTPATGDNICFSGASNGNSTLNTAFSVKSFDTGGCGGSNGSYTGTLTHSAAVTLTVSGNDAGATGGVTFRLGSSTTYTLSNATTSAISFTSTSGTSTVTANSSGASRNLGNVTFNGTGGTWQLGSAATVGSTATTTLTAGTFTLNSNNLSTGLFVSSGTGTRQLTMGSSTMTLTGTNAIFDLTTMTNFGASCCGSGTLVTNSTAFAARTFNFGAALTIGTLTIGANGTGTAGGSPLLITGPSSATLTIDTVNITGPAMLWLQGSGARAYAFTNGFSWTGTSTAPILFGSTPGSTSSAFPILTSANAMTCAWCVLTGMRFAGNGNLTATNSLDFGGLSISSGTGVISITPPVVGGVGVIGE